MTGTGLPGNARLVAIAALLLVTLAALAVWAGVATQTQRLREENQRLKISATTQRLGEMEGRVVNFRLILSDILCSCPGCLLGVCFCGFSSGIWVTDLTNDRETPAPIERGIENCDSWALINWLLSGNNTPVIQTRMKHLA